MQKLGPKKASRYQHFLLAFCEVHIRLVLLLIWMLHDDFDSANFSSYRNSSVADKGGQDT